MTKATDNKSGARATGDARATGQAKATDPDLDPAAVDEPKAPQTRVAGQCVVKSDFHVGRAVNGDVCSYHAMRYKADGTPR